MTSMPAILCTVLCNPRLKGYAAFRGRPCSPLHKAQLATLHGPVSGFRETFDRQKLGESETSQTWSGDVSVLASLSLLMCRPMGGWKLCLTGHYHRLMMRWSYLQAKHRLSMLSLVLPLLHMNSTHAAEQT